VSLLPIAIPLENLLLAEVGANCAEAAPEMNNKSIKMYLI
jgi:hypothetical protein